MPEASGSGTALCDLRASRPGTCGRGSVEAVLMAGPGDPCDDRSIVDETAEGSESDVGIHAEEGG